MKQSVLYVLLFIVFFTLVFSPACSTTEEQAIVYDITGSWQLTMDYGGGSTDLHTYIFSGSLTSGVTNDITYARNGIYTVNNMSVEITMNYHDPMCWDVSEFLTGMFTTPTTMSGTWTATATGGCIPMLGVTWTAIKL